MSGETEYDPYPDRRTCPIGGEAHYLQPPSGFSANMPAVATRRFQEIREQQRNQLRPMLVWAPMNTPLPAGFRPAYQTEGRSYQPLPSLPPRPQVKNMGASRREPKKALEKTFKYGMPGPEYPPSGKEPLCNQLIPSPPRPKIPMTAMSPHMRPSQPEETEFQAQTFLQPPWPVPNPPPIDHPPLPRKESSTNWRQEGMRNTVEGTPGPPSPQMMINWMPEQRTKESPFKHIPIGHQVHALPAGKNRANLPAAHTYPIASPPRKGQGVPRRGETQEAAPRPQGKPFHPEREGSFPPFPPPERQSYRQDRQAPLVCLS